MFLKFQWYPHRITNIGAYILEQEKKKLFRVIEIDINKNIPLVPAEFNVFNLNDVVLELQQFEYMLNLKTSNKL